MDADLDPLCIAVYCTADDLLPTRSANARRLVTDAEVVSLCVAQAIMGIPSDRRFLAVARRHLQHLFPRLPGQAGYHKRRRALAETIEWLMGVFSQRSPGWCDGLLLIDFTPVDVRAVVSRGGRPDLAGDRLPLVRAATLLIVGSRDPEVLQLNLRAAERLVCPTGSRWWRAPRTCSRSPHSRVRAGLAIDWFLARLPVVSAPGG